MGNIGTNYNEIKSQGIAVLQNTSLYNGGVLVRCSKGPVGKSMTCSSKDTYRSIYGGADVNYNSWYMIKGLFDNLNSNSPVNLHVVREYDPLSPGTASFYQFGSGGNTFTVTAGFRGDESPGVWGDSLKIQLLSGNTADTFILDVYETRNSSDYLVERTPEFEISEAEAIVNSFSKWIKVTVIGSPVLTPTANINETTTVTTLADVAGSLNNTYFNLVDGGGSKYHVWYNINSSGTLPVVAGSTGVAVVAATAATADTIATATQAAVDAIAGFSASVLTNVVTVSNTVAGSATDASDGAVPTSFTVLVTQQGTDLLPGLSGGVDPGVPTVTQAIASLDFLLNKDIQRVFSTERTDPSWLASLESWCAGKRGDILGLGASDFTETPTGTFTQYASLLIQHSYLAGYFNWGYVEKEVESGEKLIPLLGHIYGAYYVRKRENQGGYINIAPAGVNVSLRGINKLQYIDDLTYTVITTITRTYGWNVISFQPRYGLVVESSRTFSTKNKFYSIHIRESSNYIAQTLKWQLKTFQQKPNNDTVRNALAGTCRAFLTTQYRNGMFETEGGFDNNVEVKCDLENNDNQTRKNKEMICDLIGNFAEVAESINIRLTQEDGPFNATIT